jgi:hypothetical protein
MRAIMNKLTREAPDPKFFTPLSTLQGEASQFGKKQAMLQIHEFMDRYQKDIISKLEPMPAILKASHFVPQHAGSHIHDDGSMSLDASSTTKQNREKLHKIWLAMKPSYRPKSLI